MSESAYVRLFPRSMRWRLQLGLAFLLVCVLGGFGLVVDRLNRVTRFRQIDASLELRVAALGRAVRESPFVKREPPRATAPNGKAPHGPPPKGKPPGEPPLDGKPPDEPPPGGKPDDTPPLNQARPTDLTLPTETAALFNGDAGDYYYVVWYRDGAVLKKSPSAPPANVYPAVTEQDTLTHWRTRQQFREVFHCSGFGDCVLAGHSMETDLSRMRNFTWVMLAIGGALTAFGLAAGGWLTARAIRPIDLIGATAIRISRGNLAERIPVADRGTELGRLADVLNSTFARLESAFVQQRQFTADAAHELRTPLAVIIAETQTTLSRQRTTAEYREAVEICLEAAQQMRRLTESLLELARLDSGGEACARGPVDLAETACAAVEGIRPLAQQRGIRIDADLAPAVTIGGADRLGQVITNLLANAIYYNRANGEIRVSTRTDHDTVVLSVADTGAGIPSADLPRIFDRFYRVDRARSRADGHSGLGLALCKAIVEAEGGTIQVASTVEVGTTFEVRLPQAPPPGSAR